MTVSFFRLKYLVNESYGFLYYLIICIVSIQVGGPIIHSVLTSVHLNIGKGKKKKICKIV